MYLSHKIRLCPNNAHVTYFKRACGAKRFAYNWALAESKRLYNVGVKTDGYDLSRRFNAIKGRDFPWTSAITTKACEKGIKLAFDTLRKWWRGGSRYPKFKKRGKCKDSFVLPSDSTFKLHCKYLRVAKLGWVKMAQSLRFPGRPVSVTISRDGDQWFASVLVELPEDYIYPHTCENQEVVGIDLGVKKLATLSTGQVIENPKWTKQNERKLRRLNKSVSRKKNGSTNWKKSVDKLHKFHRKIRNSRQDYINKFTTSIVKTYRTVGLETLRPANMVKNKHLSKSIQDASFYEIRRQLEYKAELAGGKVVLADPFFPSSKLCANCGSKKDKLGLSERVYHCENCGIEIDRDLNAAINLKKVAVGFTETQNVCGEESSGLTAVSQTKLSSVKQKNNFLDKFLNC